MLSHHPFLKKFKRQKSLVISIIQIHVLILLFLGIILFMGSLKKKEGASFNLFSPQAGEEAKDSEQPFERKARIIPPPEKPLSESP